MFLRGTLMYRGLPMRYPRVSERSFLGVLYEVGPQFPMHQGRTYGSTPRYDL